MATISKKVEFLQLFLETGRIEHSRLPQPKNTCSVSHETKESTPNCYWIM